MKVIIRAVVIEVSVMEKYGNFSLSQPNDIDAVMHKIVIHKVSIISGVDIVSECNALLTSISPPPIFIVIIMNTTEIGSDRVAGFVVFAIGASATNGRRCDIYLFCVRNLENKSLPSPREKEIRRESPYLPSLTIMINIKKIAVDVILISDTITIREKNSLR